MKETKIIKQQFEGFQERTNNTIEEIENNETLTKLIILFIY